MNAKSPTPSGIMRQKDAARRSQEARVALDDAAKAIAERDKNTARLKALRLERDLAIAAEPVAPRPKRAPAKTTKAKTIKAT